MQQKSITCPTCGAPMALEEGISKAVCPYCGGETLYESKLVENLGEKVASSIHDAESNTQLELKRLQITQELSMLQMQLGNIRMEKRNLERDKSPQSCAHLQQVRSEERTIELRIATLQNSLTPHVISTQTPPPLIPSEETSGVVSSKSWATTTFLVFTCGLFGGHRYYTGHIKSAIFQTFTAGGFYVWWIIDIVSILSGSFKDSRGLPLNRNLKVNKTVMIIVGVIWLLFLISMASSNGSSGG